MAPGGGVRAGGGALAVPSRATVTRGVNRAQTLALSFMAIRTGIGFRHWNRVEGSKCEHCLQQCSSALHLGQLPAKSVPVGSAVEQLKQRAAATCCTRRGRRGPVTSMGGGGLAVWDALRAGLWTPGRNPYTRVVCTCDRCPWGKSYSVIRGTVERSNETSEFADAGSDTGSPLRPRFRLTDTAWKWEDRKGSAGNPVAQRLGPGPA